MTVLYFLLGLAACISAVYFVISATTMLEFFLCVELFLVGVSAFKEGFEYCG